MTEIKVFGIRPKDSIFLPQVPFNLRNDCKVGQWKVGEEDFRGNQIEISILKVAQMFGSLGQTKNTSWLQIWFVPAPNSDNLPNNTVCLTYLKKRSIEQFSQTITELMQNGEPALGIFQGSFQKHSGDYGVYFSVKWDWRTRQTPAENKQLEQIAEFLATQPKLVDLAVDLIPIDGLSSEEIQLLMASAKSQDFESPKTDNNGKR
ncbi:MAG: hypothetical protein EA365_09540 [Gloeocapsa sp. DLM2.Bin57]|nr:MAG: hypothetical protein EA365_09540 [Gloeocapsa sp. DLM2.Bin57]